MNKREINWDEVSLLEKEGFVKCLNPNQKLARFYGLTDKGKRILENLSKD